jgi:hypothetical protein
VGARVKLPGSTTRAVAAAGELVLEAFKTDVYPELGCEPGDTNLEQGLLHLHAALAVFEPATGSWQQP